MVNADDENTPALLEGHTCQLVSYGIHNPDADYRAGEDYRLLRSKRMLGVAFHVSGKDEMDVEVNMPGLFSVYNALATIAAAKGLGVPDKAIHDGLGSTIGQGPGGAGARQPQVHHPAGLRPQ